MIDDPELKAFLAKRDTLFRNPNIVDATKWWLSSGNPDPEQPTVPLAAVHKARLQWLDVTDEMIIESMNWLREHGYETTFRGAAPLTPTMRDAQRAALGKPPLNS